MQPAKSHHVIALTSRVHGFGGARQDLGFYQQSARIAIQRQGVGMRAAKKAAILGVAVFLTAKVVRAQTAVGEVNGAVADKSGGIVSGATVKLTNQATGIVDQTKTNSDGHFVFINVKPGAYTIDAEAAGFKSTRVGGFTVGVDQTVTQVVRLELGAVTETVSVRAQGAMLEPSSTELGTVITEKAITDLPLNGRNFTQLLTLTPGVTPVSTSQNKSIGGVEGNVGIPNSGFADPSIHGQQNRSKLYFYDGIINTNIRGPTYVVVPNLDLVQEFKVVGQDSKAEYGGATGGVIDMVSKSGTNIFHGSLFEYVRNDAFDARDSLNDFDPLTHAPSAPLPFRQNQFGGSFGGPIMKSKNFFYGGYDGWRYSQPSRARSYVPTPAELNGDFTDTSTSLFTSVHQIYNPYSTTAAPHAIDASGTLLALRDPFKCDATGSPITPAPNGTQPGTVGVGGVVACNKIPSALINPAMQAFFKTYSAAPNYASPSDATHNFIQDRPDRNNSNAFQLRIDHHLSNRDNFFLRYTQQDVYSYTPIGEVGSTDGTGRGRNYGGGWVHTFGPRLVLDMRAGYAGRPSVDSGQSNKDPHGLQPMKDAGLLKIDEYQGMLASMTDWRAGDDRDDHGNFGIRGPAPRENPAWSVAPNLSWLKGNHNFKAGFEYVHASRGQKNTFQQMTFAGSQTQEYTGSTASPKAVNNTGLALASALLGFPSNYQGQLPVVHGGPVEFNYASWAVYGQDEWRVASRLTLTLGLRLDALTQPSTTDGRLWNALDLFNQKWIIGAASMPPLCNSTKIAPCIPDPAFAFPPVRDNWGPRVGAAFQLNRKTVLRGGYGLYWDSLPARSQYAQNGLEAAVWPDATAIPGFDLNAPVDFSAGTSQLVTQAQANAAVSLPGASPWTVGNFPLDPDFKDARSQQWHVQIQREITPETLFTVAYAGSNNGRLDYKGKPNTAPQAFPAGTPAATIDALRPMPWVSANINYEQSIGYSHYNALETSLHHRVSNGLFLLVSYTWSKSIDVSSGYFGVENGPGGGAVVQNYFDLKSNQGVSAFDITHFLSLAALYEFPFGQGKRWLQRGPVSWILGNWQANPLFQARSGQPYTLNVSGDIANISGSGGISASTANGYGRPNIVGNPFQGGPVAANPTCTAPATVLNSSDWFNPCAFASPVNSFGNLGRTTYRGPAVYNMDLSMIKNIPLPREGMGLQMAFEAFNVFNIQNLDTPSQLNITNRSAGVITSLAQGTTPRELQFGLRFVF